MTQPALNGTVLSGAVAQAAGGTRTISHTVGSLTSGALVIAIPWIDGATQTISGVTYNGVTVPAVSSTYVEVATSDAPMHVGVALFCLVAPATGTANIVVTSTAGAGFGGGLNHAVFAANFDNVHQVTPTGGGANASSSLPLSSNQVAVTSSSNDLAVGICSAIYGVDNLAAVATMLGTKLTDTNFSFFATVFQYSSSVNPTLTWTQTAAGAGGNSQSGFSLKGTGGVAAGISHRNGIALSGISAIDGISKSGISAINGLTI